MRIIHGNGYNERERRSFTPYIHSNTLLAANTLCSAMAKLGISYQNFDNIRYGKLILSQEGSVYTWLTQEVTRAIKCIWSDENVQYVFSRRVEFDLLDSAKYFLDSLDRITSHDYVPSDQDILRVRIPTTGVQESFFHLQSVTFRIVDVGGQRSERRKWIHCFDSVTSIIFLASLCEYDQLIDDPLTIRTNCSPSLSSPSSGISSPSSGISSNSSSYKSSPSKIPRMEVSLALFSTIVSSTVFQRTSFILFLNKKDLFEEKITKSNISCYYPEYTGPEKDATAGRKFIQNLYLSRAYSSLENPNVNKKTTHLSNRQNQSSKFPESNNNLPFNSNSNYNFLARGFSTKYSKNNENKTFYTHFTAATDTQNIRFVFSSVKDTILRNNIEDYLMS